MPARFWLARAATRDRQSALSRLETRQDRPPSLPLTFDCSSPLQLESHWRILQLLRSPPFCFAAELVVIKVSGRQRRPS